MARLVDLTVALKNNTMDPNDMKITRLTHTASSRRMAKGVGVFAEVIGPYFCANDNVETLTHAPPGVVLWGRGSPGILP